VLADHGLVVRIELTQELDEGGFFFRDLHYTTPTNEASVQTQCTPLLALLRTRVLYSIVRIWLVFGVFLPSALLAACVPSADPSSAVVIPTLMQLPTVTLSPEEAAFFPDCNLFRWWSDQYQEVETYLNDVIAARLNESERVQIVFRLNAQWEAIRMRTGEGDCEDRIRFTSEREVVAD
jgi:hypothetical protein